MAQHREAPAYQEYAASLMARTEYRVLTMEGRGLLYTMRLECWVNGELPSGPPLLARVLGFDIAQVERALPEVRPFFSVEGDVLRCPELDDYRAHLNERRQKQSAGGRAGAAKTNEGRDRSSTSTPATISRVARGSLVKQSPVQSSKDESLEGKASEDSWLSDYDRASRGH